MNRESALVNAAASLAEEMHHRERELFNQHGLQVRQTIVTITTNTRTCHSNLQIKTLFDPVIDTVNLDDC